MKVSFKFLFYFFDENRFKNCKLICKICLDVFLFVFILGLFLENEVKILFGIISCINFLV